MKLTHQLYVGVKVHITDLSPEGTLVKLNETHTFVKCSHIDMSPQGVLGHWMWHTSVYIVVTES